MEENEKIYNNKDIEIKDTTLKDKIIDNLRFIITLFIILVCMCAFIYLVFFNSNNEPKPQINKYDLVEFTTEQNKKSYIDISDDNYLIYISIDEKNIMKKNIISIEYNNIKFSNIDDNQKAYIEIESKTEENIRMFSINEVTTYTYTFHLPSAEIETLKNEM